MLRRPVPPTIAHVEPLTTARALQGPFDYLAPEGAAVGQLLVVPFGRRDGTGVGTGLGAASAGPREKLASPRTLLAHSVPAELVDLARWMAREYCSTFARALQLVLPPARVREKTAMYAHRTDRPLEGERLTDGQRALLATLPRFAGPDLAALRRLERRGLIELTARAQRRAPEHAVVGRAPPPARGPAPGTRSRPRAPALTADQRDALAALAAARRGERILLHGVTGS